ncbi:PQQ-binding-like beta-propeller repeat protein [Natrialbaceae archaeon A-CW2]
MVTTVTILLLILLAAGAAVGVNADQSLASETDVPPIHVNHTEGSADDRFGERGLTTMGDVGFVVNGSDEIVAVDSSGTQQWSTTLPEQTRAAPTASDGSLFVTVDDQILALDGEDGTELWSNSEDEVAIDRDMAAVVGDYVYAADDGGGINNPPTVQAFDPDDGDLEWSTEVSNDGSIEFTADEEFVYVVSDDEVAAFDGETGEHEWDGAETLSAEVWSPPTVHDGVLYVTVGSAGDGPAIYAIDTEDGERIWRTQLNENTDVSPVVLNDTVVVAAGQTVHALDQSSGAELERKLTAGEVLDIERQGEDVLVSSEDGYLRSFDDALSANWAYDIQPSTADAGTVGWPGMIAAGSDTAWVVGKTDDELGENQPRDFSVHSFEESSLAVTEVGVSETDVEPGDTVTAEATVANEDEEAVTSTVRFEIDEPFTPKQPKTVDRQVTLEPGDHTTVTTDVSMNTSGEYAVTALEAGAEGVSPDPHPDSDSATIVAAHDEPDHDWGQPSFDAAGSNYNPLTEAPAGPLQEVWSHQSEGDSTTGFGTNPILVDGQTVLVENGTVVRGLDATTGEVEWDFTPTLPAEKDQDSLEIVAHAADDGAIFFTIRYLEDTEDEELGEPTRYARLYALEASTGAALWADDPDESYRPFDDDYDVTDDVLVVDDDLVVLESKELWQGAGSERDVELVAIDRADGDLHGEISTTEDVPQDTGLASSQLLSTGEYLVFELNETVYSVDRDTFDRESQRSFDQFDVVLSTDGDDVYVATATTGDTDSDLLDDGTVYALDPAELSAERWNQSPDGLPGDDRHHGMVLTDDVLYTAAASSADSAEYAHYAFDLEAGDPLRQDTSPPGEVDLTAADGVLYAQQTGTTEFGITSALETGEQVAEYTPTGNSQTTVSNRTVFVSNHGSGAPVYALQESSALEIDSITTNVTEADLGDTVAIETTVSNPTAVDIEGQLRLYENGGEETGPGDRPEFTLESGESKTITRSYEIGGLAGSFGDYNLHVDVRNVDLRTYDTTKSDRVAFAVPQYEVVPDGPTASFTVDPTEPNRGEEVTFDATESTPLEDLESFHWDLTGDGDVDETTSDPETTWTYDEADEYTATLEVEDDEGETAETTQTVTVTDVDDLESFEVQPIEDPVVQGESIELEFVNATDVTGEPYTTGDASLTNIDIENPLDDDPRRVALEFEDGEALSTFELLDEGETEDLSLGEVSALEAWDIDDSSVNDTYSVEIVASRLASFEVQPVDDPVVQGESLELEFVNATDVDGESYTTGDDSFTNIDIENPLDDDPRRVALEFEDGEALSTFELLDEGETEDLELEEFSEMEAWDIDDSSVNDTYSVGIVATRLASFEVQPVEDPVVQGESLELEFVNATDIDGESYTTGDDSLTNMDIENPLDDDPRRVALEFEDGEALSTFELLDEDETEDLSLGEVSELEAWDIDDPSVNDSYSVEIVASRLTSFEVQPVDDPVVQGESLELKFVNATDIDEESYTTGDGSLTNIDIENPLDDDPRRVALEFEDGEALATFEVLDDNETDSLNPEEFSELEAWDIDDSSVNDTYSVGIVASRLASFEVQPVEDPVVQGESLELEFVNATDIDGESYTTGDDSLTNIDIENPLDDDPRRVALEFEDGEALATFELLDEGETEDLSLGEVSELEAWDIDDPSVNDTYSVEIVASRLASFEVQPVDDPVIQGESLELEFVNATDIDGESYTTGDDSLTNIDIQNPLDDDPRRVALEFEDGEALSTFELLDEGETEDLDLEEFSEMEAWDIDDPSVNDSYSVEIVASRLASFEVQPVDDPVVQGESLELKFVNATDIDGEPYTTGDDSFTNIDIENPLDDDPRRVALEFEDGEALSTFELLDEDETEDLELEEFSELEAWDIDDSSVNDTYSIEIVASRLASFDVQPVEDPVVQGESLDLEFVNATDVDGESYTTGDDSLTNIDIENPLDDDPRRVALEFEDGEALSTFELLAADETEDLGSGEYTDLRAWLVADGSVEDTYSVEVLPESTAAMEVTQTSINATDLEEGEWIAVEATVENSGDDAGDHEVVFEIDGTVEAAETVSLDPAENETVAFDHQFDQAGEYDVTVDGETVATVSIEADDEDDPSPSPPPAPSPSPDISVTDAIIDTERVDVGESVSLEVALTNEGDGDGDKTLELEVDGEPVTEATVDVDAEESVSATLEHQFNDSGAYTVGVDQTAFTVIVDPAVSLTQTDAGAETAVTGGLANESVTIPLEGTVGDTDTMLENASVTPSIDTDFTVTVERATELPDEPNGLPNETADLLAVTINSTLEPDEMETATLRFLVSTDELDDQGIDPENVSLYHAVDDEWGDRETEVGKTVSREGDEYIAIHATLPHFSTVALVGKSTAAPASFTLEDLEVPGTVDVGDSFSVTGTVKNVGNEVGSETVTVRLDGEELASTSVDLKGGTTTTVDVEVDPGDLEAGVYELRLVDGDGTTLSVVDLEVKDESQDDEIPGFGVILALVALIGLCVFRVRRGAVVPM